MPAKPENILVRGVNWLGDAVMTTPALGRLREARPGARVTLLTHEKLAEIWRGHPSIDAVLTIAKGDGALSIARRLRRERFDTALVLPNSTRSAFEVFVARIPERVGYTGRGRKLLLTRALAHRPELKRMRKRTEAEVRERIAKNLPRETFPPAAHHAHDYLHLVAALGGRPAPLPPLLRVSDAEVDAFRERFGLRAGERVLGLNAGAEYGPAKRWPVERFIESATQLGNGTRWILFGGAGDRDLVAGIASALAARLGAEKIVNVAGQTGLRELCAGLRACSLLLTNDTGPMHVAAALGVPVIVPFGSTSPELTGPGFDSATKHTVLLGQAACAPCFLRECPVDFRCMKSIAVSEVVQTARQILSRPAARL